MPRVIDQLLSADDVCVQWKVRRDLLEEDLDSRTMRRLADLVRASPRATALREGPGTVKGGSYANWQGAHWATLALADLGYPPGDTRLQPMVDQLLKARLHDRYWQECDLGDRPGAKRSDAGAALPVLGGRHRVHASVHGGTLYAVTRLGLADERCAQIADLLRRWQWPDAGWNCDMRLEASTSSVHETWLPARGLAAATGRGSSAAHTAARRAAGTLLDRGLIYRRKTGMVVRPAWMKLRFPAYWHYDLLAGLRVLADLDLARDNRAQRALDVLERHRLESDYWPAHGRRYRGTTPGVSLHDWVGWGPAHPGQPNEWVTVEALRVLKAAGRITVP
ncbi:hypothetical protein [Streptomyces sp. 7N604]|uniref:hypothetical protein n=1 Tax=Streptomyces sp. 7N604 TaxID=3457415 RepID=UPI003FCF99FA